MEQVAPGSIDAAAAKESRCGVLPQCCVYVQNSSKLHNLLSTHQSWLVVICKMFPGVSRCFQVFAWILSVCRWVLECTWYLVLRLFEAQIDSAQGQPGEDLGIMCHVVETEQLAVEKICHLVHHLASEFGQFLLCGRFNDSTRIPLVWFVVSISFNSD